MMPGEKRRFKTAHCLDMNIRQAFADLLSRRNRTHWDEMDLKEFLAAKGRLVFERIAHPQTGGNDVIPSVLTSEKFKNIKRIIVCVYSHSAMTPADYGKILEQVSAAVSPEAKILTGWICDEKTDQHSVAINLIAVCSE
jgi:cell division GTPase FtsZ